MATAAIDFGTSNSVLALCDGKNIQVVPYSKDSIEIPSVMFFSFSDMDFYIGHEAYEKIFDGDKGRYFVSLKSFLNSENDVTTILGNKEYSLSELISVFLKNFKKIIETYAKTSIDRVVLGRPVRFHDSDDLLDRLAQERLEKAAKLAGFKEVFFEYEPIAAALFYEEKSEKEEIILVADIGGGTTDYTILKTSKSKDKFDRSDDILSTNGVYVGGNNFDSMIIKRFISKYLGKDSFYINMGKKLQVGNRFYADLSMWHKFQNLYSKDVIEEIEKLIYMSLEKEKLQRLLELIKENHYFDFSSKIVKAKENLSNKEKTKIDMDFFEKPFSVTITKNQFEDINQANIEKISLALKDTMKQAKISTDKIDKVFLTGGTTLIPAVKKIYHDIFGGEKLVHTNVFSSVGYGLALKSKQLPL